MVMGLLRQSWAQRFQSILINLQGVFRCHKTFGRTLSNRQSSTPTYERTNKIDRLYNFGSVSQENKYHVIGIFFAKPLLRPIPKNRYEAFEEAETVTVVEIRGEWESKELYSSFRDHLTILPCCGCVCGSS